MAIMMAGLVGPKGAVHAAEADVFFRIGIQS